MDPDDMLLNQELFEQLYNYNLKLNLDIIEFTVIYQYAFQFIIWESLSKELF